jgi:hypothetical protein
MLFNLWQEIKGRSWAGPFALDFFIHEAFMSILKKWLQKRLGL